MRQQLPVTPENQRQVLGNALSLVRFPLMSKEEFTAGPAQSGLLNYSEAGITCIFHERISYNRLIIARRQEMKIYGRQTQRKILAGPIFIFVLHTESEAYSGFPDNAAMLHDWQGTDRVQVSAYRE